MRDGNNVMSHCIVIVGACLLAAACSDDSAGSTSAATDSDTGTSAAATTTSAGTASTSATTQDGSGSESQTGDTTVATASESESASTTAEPSTTADPTASTTTTDPTATTDPSTTDPSPSCGDGVLDPGEACDDGDANADGGACTLSCTLASCGDGLVHVGVEECDDANDDDSDACLSACVAAACGDGVVHEGVEQCDDSNKIETDDCLSDCTLAACGDSFIHEGVEQCDDNNKDESDGCTSKCNVPSACKQIHIDAPQAESGAYTIVPAGSEPFKVWCDMTTDEGGWTLAYATREFRSKDVDPRVHFQVLENSSILSPDGDPMMFGHAVRGGVDEVMWRCSPDGIADKWWVTGVPSYMLNKTHQTPPQALTYLRKSPNTTKVPAFFIEGSTNFPQLGYFMINTTQASCTAADAVWGGFCFSYNCNGPGQSGLCVRSACDGVEISNGANAARRFWIYYR